MTEHRKIVKSAWGITAWTAVSRVAGMVREMTIAHFLGASGTSDAYYTAFRIPNTFRAIVGEGGLPGAFVPMAKKVERERPGEEGVYAGRVLSLLVAVLTVLTVLGMLAAPFVVTLFASAFRKTPQKFDLAVLLTRWMFPYILFVSAASLLEAFLNAKGKFQLSAATPIAFNLASVAGAFALVPMGVPAPTALAIGVLLGGFLQFAIQVPAVRRLGFRFGGSPVGDPDVKRTAIQLGPRLYGYGIGQLNFLISNQILASLGDAFVSYNFYAWRIADLVRGGFVESVTRVILPKLSEQAVQETAPTEAGRVEFKGTVIFGLRLSAFITLPSAVGLALLAAPILDVLFRRGEFTRENVTQSALALLFYAPALFAVAAVKILTQAFYALHDTRTPVVVGTFDLVAFSLLCLVLKGPLQHAGIALATSAGFWLNAGLLLWVLRRRIGPLGMGSLASSVAKIAGATVVMGAVVFALAERALPYPSESGLLPRALWLALLIGVASATYIGAAKALGVSELEETLGTLLRRKEKR